ncbi:hypothetical protein D3C86_1378720 [compost metagenome]
MAATLQGPGRGAHEHQGVGVHHRLLHGDGADTEAVAQHHHQGGGEDQEQGQPGAGLTETRIERLDGARQFQQGRR